jgi:hypothetical protein
MPFACELAVGFRFEKLFVCALASALVLSSAFS